MNSCLYECTVMHARFSPRRHRFVYRIFLFAIDLDELAALTRRLPLFSHRRRAIYAFRESDYLPTAETLHNPQPTASRPTAASSGRIANPARTSASPPAATSLKARVVAYLAEQQIDLTGGRVLLVTLPRVFGYLFNPVSFYFCYDRTGQPVAALAEVTNTFREMKPYLVPAVASAAPSAATTFHRRVPKHFYVSPFSDVDLAFDFSLQAPGERLTVQIDDYAGDDRLLTSTLAGPRRELTAARLAWFTVKYPLITLRTITLIHWHALLLWRKRVPWFAKAARPADQRDLYRPHRSVAAHRPHSAAPASSASLTVPAEKSA